jgi:hypothetical protein
VYNCKANVPLVSLIIEILLTPQAEYRCLTSDLAIVTGHFHFKPRDPRSHWSKRTRKWLLPERAGVAL